MSFSSFVGNEEAKLALILNAVDPRCGGVLIVGERGTGKSSLCRLFRSIIPQEVSFVELPLHITEDSFLGGVDLEATMQEGRRIFRKGVLASADRGILFVDDINLLPSQIQSLLMEVQGKGEYRLEREGMSLRLPARFIPLASMNPDEGALSPHLLDRFGTCVVLSGLQEKEERLQVMKGGTGESDDELKARIAEARKRLNEIVVSPELQARIVDICLENNAFSHRADIFLLYAARACAAFFGETRVTEEHLDRVAPLVLLHRRIEPQPMPPEEEEPQEKEQKGNQQEQKNQNREQQEHRGDTPDPGSGSDSSGNEGEGGGKEEVFSIGSTFPVRRLSFRRDRQKRNASGRRTKTGSKDRGGRYLRATLRGEKDIALDATLRAAAPFQGLRNRAGRLVIQQEDLRYKERERRMGHLVVFVVDGSGSMGACKRMAETKGAVQSLLMDCYQKRDRVSLIVFRKDRAEVVLPPTASVELASRRLAEIPVGGKTPISAGLLEAHNLIKKTMLRNPETRPLVVVITDGRANKGMTEMPLQEEMQKVSALLSRLQGTDFIVVDTEEKKGFLQTDLALQIAQWLNADYYPVDALRSELLAGIVEGKKERSMLGGMS